MLKKVFISAGLVWGIIFHHQAQSLQDLWVDSVFQTLTVEEKIGQLFMVPVFARSDPQYITRITEVIESHTVGGIVYLDGGPYQIAKLNRRLQQRSKVPLLTGVDAGRGLGQSIDSTMLFPPALALGAVQDRQLIYETGAEIARQMKLLGLHINFAPSAERMSRTMFDSLGTSFGENPEQIALTASAYVKGLQDNGVIACAKFFPIRGLTVTQVDRDGKHSVNTYADSAETYAFNRLFDEGVKAVLPASSDIPLFYEKKVTVKKNQLSPGLLTSIYASQWLKRVRKYEGLVIVSIPEIIQQDAEEKGGDAELSAFQAGNDIILFPSDINPAIRKIRRLLRKEPEYETLLDQKVKKLLRFKYEAGLNRPTEPVQPWLYDQLHTPSANSLLVKLLEQSIIRVRDDKKVLPFYQLEDKSMATVSLGRVTDNEFAEMTSNYVVADHFSDLEQQPEEILSHLASYNTVIVSLYEDPSKHESIINHLRNMQTDRNVVMVVFGSPLWLEKVDGFGTVVYGWTGDNTMLSIVPQALFGATGIQGRLPVTLQTNLQEGQGIPAPPLQRMGYSFPEDVGMDSDVLQKIERIAREAIDLKATPGCQVLVAREGKVVYQQSFGHLSYEKTIPVDGNTLYDLASITKVMATLQAIMFLHDRGMIDVYKKASFYLPELKGSNKENYTLKDILTHQAGLWPFLPFWSQTMKGSVHLPEYYSSMPNENYPFQVSEHLYTNVSMRDSLWNWIIQARVRDKISRTPYDYRYSDMGFYILQHIAEKLLNQPMEDFLRQNLYDPLGAATTTYLPLKKFDKTRIAPTEDDKIFRRELLVGTVHDQGAAMHGGVAGHAGLFSTANDLAKVGQMLLQEGYYGGIQYYKPSTVQQFTQRQYERSRRGLGWDKPMPSEWNSPTSLYASPKTFGHTGFTGTCIWIDPEFDLVYVFLSNRVHPDMTNPKLLAANIRSRIQDVIYEAIFQYCEEKPADSSTPDTFVRQTRQ